MKKTGIWNSELAKAIAYCGHGKCIMICDAGFPVPFGVPLIDLAVCRGLPRFKDVLHAVLSELAVEHYTVCNEMSAVNPDDYKIVLSMLDKKEHDEVDQPALVESAKNAMVCVRTGEDMPYCNIVLRSASCVDVV